MIENLRYFAKGFIDILCFVVFVGIVCSWFDTVTAKACRRTARRGRSPPVA